MSYMHGVDLTGRGGGGGGGGLFGGGGGGGGAMPLNTCIVIQNYIKHVTYTLLFMFKN